MFRATSVRYLGHVVYDGTIIVDPKKLEAINTWLKPISIKEVQLFVGLANYYNNFIKQFDEIATPLTNFLSPKKLWFWGPDEQKAFEILCSTLCLAPILRLPDFSQPFFIKLYGSENSVGATLFQEYGGKLLPIAQFRNKMSSTERNYNAQDQELTVIAKLVMKWRGYLDEQNTTIYIDHKPLVNLFTRLYLSKWQASWVECLSQLRIIIKYKPGPLHVVPDTLNRRPVWTLAYLSCEDAALVTKQLRSNALQNALQYCVQAAIDALSAYHEIAFLKCKYYSTVHLDSGTWDICMHITHACSSCKNQWKKTPQVQGNPFAMFETMLYGKRLVLAKAPGKLTLLTLEPSWLASVYEGQRNPQNRDMARLLEAAYIYSSTFIIRQVHGFDMLYHQTDDLLQLVIFQYKGL